MRAKTLLIPTPFRMRAGRALPLAFGETLGSTPGRSVQDGVRALFARRLPPPPPPPPPLARPGPASAGVVVFQRRAGSRRSITNLPALLAALRGHLAPRLAATVDAVEPDGTPLTALATLLSSCALLMSVHGGQLNNAVFGLRPGAAVAEFVVRMPYVFHHGRLLSGYGLRFLPVPLPPGRSFFAPVDVPRGLALRAAVLALAGGDPCGSDAPDAPAGPDGPDTPDGPDVLAGPGGAAWPRPAWLCAEVRCPGGADRDNANCPRGGGVGGPGHTRDGGDLVGLP